MSISRRPAPGNALYPIHRYFQNKDASLGERARIQQRTTLIGCKAAPDYVNAKIIIKLINNIAEVANNDPDVSPYLKLIVPNYNVMVAGMLERTLEWRRHGQAGLVGGLPLALRLLVPCVAGYAQYVDRNHHGHLLPPTTPCRFQAMDYIIHYV